ncbi:MAG: adenylate/guanylate cyclase domain-containing protein [Mariprofundaceae bacterium]
MRFPIRWRWMLLVSVTVALAVLILSLILLDMERDAWLRSQSSTAKIMVTRLGDEVKSFMLAGGKLDKTQVDIIVSGFRDKVPTVLGIQVRYADGELYDYGDIGTHPALKLEQQFDPVTGRSLSEDLWYVQSVSYAKTPVGSIAVRFSGDDWEHLANRFIASTLMVAVIVILLASIGAYLIATRMSRPLEALARAAQHVADGDFATRIALSGNDEITDAGRQFNDMVSELAHKQKLRDVVGRYLNPALVDDVFSNENTASPSRRQHVAVLFADMVGFTAFSETHASEEVVRILNQHFDLFHRIIDYYGGHVDKYIGDAVMAVFNHPHADKAYIRHAAMAGIAMTRACRTLAETEAAKGNETDIQFRVGIHHGEAIVGNIGAVERLEYTVIGDAVNVASRMTGLGEGGEVILPHDSFKCVGEGLGFASIGEKSIKGIQKPIKCGKLVVESEKMCVNLDHAVALAMDLTRLATSSDAEGENSAIERT